MQVVHLAVVADIHGNRHALEAVVADARSMGVDRWWALGDLAAIGPQPVEVLELVADLPDVQVIRGNTERYSLTTDRPPPTAADVLADPDLLELYSVIQRSFSWTGGALAAGGWATWVGELPIEVRAVLPDGTALLGVHASPGRDDGEGITPHRDEEALQAELAGAGAALVIAGHTHQPTDRVVGAIHAVNAGSVSNPITDDLRASYVLVHADRHGYRIEHRRVAYDREAFLGAVGQSGHPAADYIASFQRGEQVRFRAGPSV
jgi:predicted phosphodiesterase